jgi:uncharacterized protein YjiS (DUF1127 family)
MTLNLLQKVRRWRKVQNTVYELSRLSTRELDDLGISRANIPDIARKSV